MFRNLAARGRWWREWCRPLFSSRSSNAGLTDFILLREPLRTPEQ